MCDVVGVEAQMLQVGKVDRCDVLAETCEVKLYRESERERKLDENKQQTLCKFCVFKHLYPPGQSSALMMWCQALLRHANVIWKRRKLLISDLA